MRYNGSRLARATFVVPGLLLAAACGGEVNADAYGNFEAIEVVVSAQTTGQVLDFLPVEGMVLDRGSRAATIDTTQLVLERAQLAAQQGRIPGSPGAGRGTAEGDRRPA